MNADIGMDSFWDNIVFMWPSRRRWAALACLVFPVCLAGASQDPWLAIKSANFELYTTAGERAGRDLIKHFEQVRSFFMQAFGSRLTAARPARLIVFRNEKEYQPYRPNEFAGAFYQPGAAHDFIVMSGASSEHYPMAIHEFTHLMIHQSGMEIPPWLNEGLAELYSSLEPRGDKMLVGELIPAGCGCWRRNDGFRWRRCCRWITTRRTTTKNRTRACSTRRAGRWSTC